MRPTRPIARFIDTQPPASIQEKFGLAIGDVGRAWRDKLAQRLHPLELSRSKWTALLYLSRIPAGMSQTELARMLGIEAPTVTRLLQQLEHAGYITRETPPEDARRKLVRLTPKARKLVTRINAAIGQLRAETVAKLSVGDAKAGFAAIQQLQRYLDEA